MCDRTNEFNLLVDRQVKQNNVTPNKVNKRFDTPKSRSDFHEAAAEVAKGIHRTSGLLSKLTKLVRRQGLFDDPTEEINGLVFSIKQDLDALNSKCDSAQQYVDNKKRQLGERNQLTNHNVNVVSQLKTELMNATKDFKSVLETRTSKIKDQQVKKIQLTGNGSLSPLQNFATTNALSQPIKGNNNELSSMNITNQNRSAFPQSPYSKVALDEAQDKSSNSLALQPMTAPMYQQQQLLLAPPATTQYFEQREQAVTEVERTIGELGQLFKRLATMINEQQELVERIDDDVESAISNADKAQSALLKTYEKVSSNKALYVKLLAILSLFAVFFVLFMM